METSAQGQWQQLIDSAEIVLCLPGSGLFQEPAVQFNNLCAWVLQRHHYQPSELCWARGIALRGQDWALLSHLRHKNWPMFSHLHLKVEQQN